MTKRSSKVLKSNKSAKKAPIVASSAPELNKKPFNWKLALTIGITVIGTVAVLVLMWFGYKTGMLANPDKMQAFFRQIGPIAPVVFVLYQVLQVIIPLIPAGFSVGIGMLMFGLAWGLILNVIPIIIGSMINFHLSKRFGWVIIESVVSEKEVTIAKSWTKINRAKFEQFWVFRPLRRLLPEKSFNSMMDWLTSDEHFYESIVFITMLLPGFPSDLLCFVFGLMDIKPRRFLIILLITKPINTLIYGWIFAASVTGVFQLIH